MPEKETEFSPLLPSPHTFSPSALYAAMSVRSSPARADAAGNSPRQRALLDRLNGMLIASTEQLQPRLAEMFGEAELAEEYFPPSPFAKKPTRKAPTPLPEPLPLPEPEPTLEPEPARWSGTPADQEVWAALYKDLWRPAEGEDTSWMAHAEGWHENALQRAFDGAWDDAIGWLTKMQNEHTQQHPVDCAMVSFNLGVLYLETTKADRLLLSARAFAEAIEAHESGPAGDEGKPNPVLTDAKQWHAGAMELHSALVQTTTADAKVLETKAAAFVTAKDFDAAIEAWGNVSQAWLRAGAVLDGAVLENEDLLEDEIKQKMTNARAKTGEATAARDKASKGRKKK